MRDDDRGRYEPRRRRYPPPRKRSHLPLILVGVGAGLLALCCGGGVVLYPLWGVDEVNDPAQVKAALDRHADPEVPPEFAPRRFATEITGYETFEYESPSGRSFIRFGTGPRQTLSRSGTVRESRDRGTQAAGGRVEEPREKKVIKMEIRGKRAEFEYKRYADFEVVTGYFQGKQYPVAVEAEFFFSEFPAGRAEQFVGGVR